MYFLFKRFRARLKMQQSSTKLMQIYLALIEYHEKCAIYV